MVEYILGLCLCVIGIVLGITILIISIQHKFKGYTILSIICVLSISVMFVAAIVDAENILLEKSKHQCNCDYCELNGTIVKELPND